MTTPATRTLVIEREMPHPPEKIWRALTEGALLKEWLLENDFEPTVGHKFRFRATPEELERRNRLRSPDRRTPQEALLQLGLFGDGEHRRLDAGRDRRRNAAAHGAVWLRSRPGG